MYNILIEFCIPVKLVKLIKMCLPETYNRVRVGKHLSDLCSIRNYLKQGDSLSPLLFYVVLGNAIRRVQENLTLDGTHQFLIYANDANILVGS